MYGEGKQVLRQLIRKKRAIEGLDEVPDDLFAKKPRHEMSEDEFRGMMERRKKNKEAAERSRKKKKVEFEKLQSENDQLNQDKCELVAMVQKLKTDISGFRKENDHLRTNYEHLKRWIGKRSAELGLTKFAQNDAPNKGSMMETDLSTTPLTRGNPLLYTPDNCIVAEEKIAESGRRSSSPRSVSPATKSSVVHLQPASRPQLQTPWLVDSMVKGEPAPANHTEALLPFPMVAPQLPEKQPLVVAPGKQVVYLPKDAIIVIQDDRAAVVGGTETRQVVMASPKHAVEPPEVQNTGIPWNGSGMARLSGNLPNGLAASEHGQDIREADAGDITKRFDLATATAVESLLKLG